MTTVEIVYAMSASFRYLATTLTSEELSYYVALSSLFFLKSDCFQFLINTNGHKILCYELNVDGSCEIQLHFDLQTEGMPTKEVFTVEYM